MEEIAALYMAAGIDPKNCAIMVQSAVPRTRTRLDAHRVTPVGWLERMTQYRRGRETGVDRRWDLAIPPS